MTTASYQQLTLNWEPQGKTDKPFIIFTLLTVLIVMAIGLFLGSIEVPKETERKKVVIPERVANFILDKPKPKPKPKPIVKKEPPKPKPIIEEAKPEPKKKPKVVREKKKEKVVLTKEQAQARDTASKSGLLALSSELSDLMDTSDVDKMVAKKVSKGGAVKTKDTSTDVLTANTNKGSGGVSSDKTKQLLASNGTSSTLDASQIDAAQQQMMLANADITIVEGVAAEEEKKEYKRTGSYRAEEDIAYVMDKNKSKLHRLYRKARRTNPGIKGKIVLEITIAPNGNVLDVKVVSSELEDAKLEARLVARVKGFNFGAESVKQVTVTYPIEFLPS